MLGSLLWALAQAAIALVVIVAVGRLLMRPLFHLVAATRSPELFMAACLLVVVATGLLAQVSGLSMALGAFIAGLLLAETEYRRAIEAAIDPFKGLLLGVFFVTVGMGLDVTRLLETPLEILLAASGLIALKGAIVFALARAYGLGTSVALESALLLGPGGEFAFVILGSAMALGLVSPGLGQNVLLMATITMVAIPFLSRLGQALAKRIEARQPLNPEASVPPPPDEVNHVIVLGFGRVGQLVADMLGRHNLPYLAVDADPARVARERRRGQPVYFGDGTYPEFLRACGIDRARALVITVDAPSAIEGIVAAARQERPNLTIVARARDARHATRLYDLGVDDAVPETIEASLQLSEAVLIDVGVPVGHVIASIHQRRDEYRAVLKKNDAAARQQPEFRSRRASR
jgi:CPA2 family monovalent cation:H+ antiporter-2